ncbi:nucleoside hydrolase [Rhodoferax sp.]|uniref:nucleoside hydrolase n=1 Tax=Rhodoferax sp. TaxID=50421 RepID=UPI002605E87B|nr:nucleoside hydrolase [Rhodoferax sp.]MDD2924972.1 nucleoside hydrolase [Rhodoferax sp.]
MTSSFPRKVIFDTDPGVDDAMALYYALAHPDIDVVGITTTFGNVHVEQAAINALYLCTLTGRAIPVTLGASQPMVKTAEAPPTYIHGVDGLGNLPRRVDATGQLDTRSSAQFMVDMARQYPGQITLVAVGPLGNLAAALALAPELPTLVREVILMGGTVLEAGNVSPVAEANIWNDPHAADVVFTAGWPLIMVGLDVTHQVILPLALFKSIAEHHQHVATDTLYHAVDFYSAFYSQHDQIVGQVHGCYGHDVLAFVVLTNPELFTLQTGRVRVATEGLAQGQTIMRRKDISYPQHGWHEEIPHTQVCLKVQANACKDVIKTTLMRNWLRPSA